jgi:hypothetical protein
MPKLTGEMPLTWCFALERVTGIEPALAAWNQAGTSAQCFRVPFPHVKSSCMSHRCAGIQVCPTSL